MKNCSEIWRSCNEQVFSIKYNIPIPQNKEISTDIKQS